MMMSVVSANSHFSNFLPTFYDTMLCKDWLNIHGVLLYTIEENLTKRTRAVLPIGQRFFSLSLDQTFQTFDSCLTRSLPRSFPFVPITWL